MSVIPWWCKNPENPNMITLCKECKYVEIWGGNEYSQPEYHCKKLRYRDHTGTSCAAPCLYIDINDCPVHRKTLFDFCEVQD